MYSYTENGSYTTLSTVNVTLTAMSLPLGSYYLVETMAPSGKMSYGKKIPFTIAPDGSQTLNRTISVKDNNIVMPNLKEVMKETMSEIKHSGFNRRLRKYIKESEVIPMTFLNEQHRLSFNAALDRIGQYDRKNFALVAALYLLTADFRLWNQARRYVENHGISFGKLRPKNCSEYSYPLYCAAKDLYLGTRHITINDLADNKLINAKTFALICNAMAIRKYGLGAIQFTDEPKT